MHPNSKHAIVYGASGLIGWALVDQLLHRYPEIGTFAKVTAITNRPISLSDSYWPEPAPDGPELQLVSGIDLRQDHGATLAGLLRDRVKDIETVTHVYYLGIRRFYCSATRQSPRANCKSVHGGQGPRGGGGDEPTHVPKRYRSPQPDQSRPRFHSLPRRHEGAYHS
jgi:hypothetical protein